MLTATEFAEEYGRLNKRLCGLLIKFGTDPSAIDDVAQEIWLQAWQSRAQYRGDSQFLTWLFAIALNKARGTIRKRKRIPDMVSVEELEWKLPGPGPSSDETIDRERRAVVVRSAIDRLPAKLKVVMQMFYVQGLSEKEAFERHGIVESTFRVRLFRGRLAVRETLGRRKP